MLKFSPLDIFGLPLHALTLFVCIRLFVFRGAPSFLSLVHPGRHILGGMWVRSSFDGYGTTFWGNGYFRCSTPYATFYVFFCGFVTPPDQKKGGRRGVVCVCVCVCFQQVCLYLRIVRQYLNIFFWSGIANTKECHKILLVAQGTHKWAPPGTVVRSLSFLEVKWGRWGGWPRS